MIGAHGNLLSTGTRYADLTTAGAVAVSRNNEKYGVTINNIRKHIEKALTDDLIRLGEAWYKEAQGFAFNLANHYLVPARYVVGVIAALSPRESWVSNKALTERTLSGFQEYNRLIRATPEEIAKRIGGTLPANLLIAVKILQGEPIDVVLTGAKRRSFYNNILSGGEAWCDDVTVDTWMQRAAMAVSPDQGMSLDNSINFLRARSKSTGGVGAGYVAIAEAVRKVAADRGLSTATVQAAYWIGAAGSVHGWHHKGHGKSAHTYDN